MFSFINAAHARAKDFRCSLVNSCNQAKTQSDINLVDRNNDLLKVGGYVNEK
jgi:hypothetical protein